MENKRYVLKETAEVSQDGTENKEHVFDMLHRAEMCVDNIQSNTDVCMSIFKLEQGKFDEDEEDALQLLCQDCIDVEAESCLIVDEIEIIKDKIEKHLAVSEAKVEELLKQVLLLEFKSENLVEKIIKK